VAGMRNRDRDPRPGCAHPVEFLDDPKIDCRGLPQMLKDVTENDFSDAARLPRPREFLQIMQHVRHAELVNIYVPRDGVFPATEIKLEQISHLLASSLCVTLAGEETVTMAL